MERQCGEDPEPIPGGCTAGWTWAARDKLPGTREDEKAVLWLKEKMGCSADICSMLGE